MKTSAVGFGALSAVTGVVILAGVTNVHGSQAIIYGIPFIIGGAFLIWASLPSTNGKLTSSAFANLLIYLVIFGISWAICNALF